MTRCVGCQWRVPKKLGGQGILCWESENGDKCPAWVINLTVNYMLKSVLNGNESLDERILEANRL